ncbi:MAG TPA: hypothetical protein VJG90_00540 [Candidatus Nanoarchaeia archaeon]|nr:hypothetical protein [Candidatus Nanoarchaeia archaeon]
MSNRKKYIHGSIRRYYQEDVYFGNKRVRFRSHAILRAIQRQIAFPQQVLWVIETGRVVRFGKHGIKFIKRSSKGDIVCVGEELGDRIIIKTVERGN